LGLQAYPIQSADANEFDIVAGIGHKLRLHPFPRAGEQQLMASIAEQPRDGEGREYVPACTSAR
jgi:hypothetical protein